MTRTQRLFSETSIPSRPRKSRRRKLSRTPGKETEPKPERNNKVQVDSETVRVKHLPKLYKDIYAALKDMEEANEGFVLQIDGEKMTIQVDDRGPYLLEWMPHSDSGYLSMISPKTGEHRYIYDHESTWWVAQIDGHILHELLTREILASDCKFGFPNF